MAVTQKIVWLFVIANAVTYCHGFPRYQMEIPNGDRVPDPCDPDKLWAGVGHAVREGGGARNAFGEDFDHVSQYKWSKELCEKDSDGDGISNGAELGDPDCTWKEGDVLNATDVKLSHPGVCEPFYLEVCVANNAWDKVSTCVVRSDSSAFKASYYLLIALVLSTTILYNSKL